MPSDRAFAAYMLMLTIFLTAVWIGFSVVVLVAVGAWGLVLVVPLAFVILPLLAWLVWDMVHTIIHNDILWDLQRKAR